MINTKYEIYKHAKERFARHKNLDAANKQIVQKNESRKNEQIDEKLNRSPSLNH